MTGLDLIRLLALLAIPVALGIVALTHRARIAARDRERRRTIRVALHTKLPPADLEELRRANNYSRKEYP